MSETIALTTKYRLVLLDDQDVEIGTVTALNLNPQSILVVMPTSEDMFFPDQLANKLWDAFGELDIRTLILPRRVSFVRLEQVSE